jgi:signal transduction histidine kinase
MFKSLRTSTKLLLLCGVFSAALLVANYALVAEKQIAIHFARKELVGVQRLKLLREVYAAILKENFAGSPNPAQANAIRETLDRLAATQGAEPGKPDTASLEHALREAVDKFGSAPDDGARQASSIEALSAARNLASRMGDDSNLTLDPDLDSYYVQDIVVAKIPALLSEIGELQSAFANPASAPSPAETLAVRGLVLEGTIRSTLEGVKRDLQGSYRGASGARLRQVLDPGLTAMISAWDHYLDAVKVKLGTPDAPALDDHYAAAVDSAINAWTISLGQLKQLLNARLSNLLSKLRNSVLLNGLVAALSLGFALLVARRIVRPLHKLEHLADEVGQTKDYKLRSDYVSRDEIGGLAASFNSMLAELEAAREREAADAAQRAAMQAELARVARVTTMGEMAASIAHEINQPLAAIANNASASLRWLGRKPPDVERARSVLERVVGDAGRASAVISSIRALLEKGGQDRVELDVNDLIREVLAFARGDLKHHGIAVQAELAEDLPRITGVRVQLQQVLLNLIANAVESMAAVEHRRRILTVRSQRISDRDIAVTVEDMGTGIAPGDLERIFEPFFSTKPEGMGMGLAICRSIVEAHGGRISASSARDGGSVFQLSLPREQPSHAA